MDKNLLGNLETKERTNFNNLELDRLQTILTKYQHVLFCKKTDRISTKQKKSAWSKVALEFNACADTPRTVKQLKYKFENLKRTAKKGACKERQELRRTGGGPPPTPLPGLGDARDWLRAILPSSIDGNTSIYDDDVIDLKPVSPAKKPADDIDADDIEEIGNLLTGESHLRINKIPDSEMFDPSTPYSSVKKPVSSPLKRRAMKRRSADINNANDNVVWQLLREKKLSVMDKLEALELTKINETIRHAQELHEQTLRHNEERHKAEMEKLQLDIKIFKKSAEFY